MLRKLRDEIGALLRFPEKFEAFESKLLDRLATYEKNTATNQLSAVNQTLGLKAQIEALTLANESLASDVRALQRELRRLSEEASNRAASKS